MSATEKPSLLSRTARGAGWVIAFRMITRLLGIVSTLTLVRLLGPGDFGLIALASSFTTTVDALSNLSVHEAIIRERAPDRAMYDTAFTMSLLRGLLTGVLIAAAAWPVAEFFREPRLVSVLLVLALSNLIVSLENIKTANFMRDFAFDREFRLWTIPRIVQVVATIGFALLWHSYWALAFGIITSRLVRTVLSYVMLPFWPRLTLVAWRRITGFTSWTWAISMVQVLRARSDTVLIGRLFSPAQVGIYALGGEIATLPMSELVEPLTRACFPAFSELRNTGQEVAPTYLRLLAAAALIVLPAGVGIAAVADPLVRLAFGPRWLEAIPMVQILGITATLGLLGGLSMTLFSAYGMLRTIFAITLGGTVFRVGLLLTFVPGGSLTTAAMTGAVAMLAEQCVYLLLTVRHFEMRAWAVLTWMYRSLLGTAAMAGGLAWLQLGFVTTGDRFALQLVEDVAAGVAIYVVSVGMLWVMAGRPDGPERDLLGTTAGLMRRLRGMLATIAIWLEIPG